MRPINICYVKENGSLMPCDIIITLPSQLLNHNLKPRYDFNLIICRDLEKENIYKYIYIAFCARFLNSRMHGFFKHMAIF